MGVLQNVPRHVPVGHLSTSWALVHIDYSTAHVCIESDDAFVQGDHLSRKPGNVSVVAALPIESSSSSRMRVINHSWSATKQRPHPQSVAEISRQLCLHRLLMSTGCKSSHNGFLDVSRSNGGLSISGWIGQLWCLTIWHGTYPAWHNLPSLSWYLVFGETELTK